MANHFRSSERQGDDRLDSTSPQVPQADAVQGDGSFDPQSHVDAIAREEAANVRSTAAHAAPVAQAPADPAPQAPADAEPLQPVTTVTAHTPEDAPQAPQGEGLVVSQTAGDIESQPETKSVFAPLQDDGNRVVPHTGRPTISLRNATLIYPAQPNKPALDGVSLDIYPGEFVFVVGHSGSGKSTLLKLLTRELRATSGKVIVAGQDLTKLRDRKVPYLRRQIGTVYQDFKLLPDKTVYENVAFALECIGKPRAVIKVQVPETLRLVGLAEKMDNYPDQLSGGEQQRVSVARAMVNRPPLLVCDEPTGNLDPAISLGIMRLLDRINRTGTTVVMATHDREMVDSMRRRVIALEAGHVVRDQEKGGYGFYGAI
ncbi:cell division ATP-binding protein FtsE [Parafannyhessea umbonata]|uniref:cell division ATP-binding protein FtsE n=1 Tax=Parafannyhessea TaxID=2847312 RepID=UPI0026F17AD6|nr:cell division ATP-binding protein FtsE [Parafannyhessea umbonata]MCI6681296.1 cell division ATP-binding protein FtsE [Parafannyhessea umbonata]MCI7219350.1 cell division ATP-binding protein FtsE [Parafannyhessea umbonata]